MHKYILATLCVFTLSFSVHAGKCNSKNASKFSGCNTTTDPGTGGDTSTGDTGGGTSTGGDTTTNTSKEDYTIMGKGHAVGNLGSSPDGRYSFYLGFDYDIRAYVIKIYDVTTKQKIFQASDYSVTDEVYYIKGFSSDSKYFYYSWGDMHRVNLETKKVDKFSTSLNLRKPIAVSNNHDVFYGLCGDLKGCLIGVDRSTQAVKQLLVSPGDFYGHAWHQLTQDGRHLITAFHNSFRDNVVLSLDLMTGESKTLFAEADTRLYPHTLKKSGKIVMSGIKKTTVVPRQFISTKIFVLDEASLSVSTAIFGDSVSTFTGTSAIAELEDNSVLIVTGVKRDAEVGDYSQVIYEFLKLDLSTLHGERVYRKDFATDFSTMSLFRNYSIDAVSNTILLKDQDATTGEIFIALRNLDDFSLIKKIYGNNFSIHTESPDGAHMLKGNGYASLVNQGGNWVLRDDMPGARVYELRDDRKSAYFLTSESDGSRIFHVDLLTGEKSLTSHIPYILPHHKVIIDVTDEGHDIFVRSAEKIDYRIFGYSSQLMINEWTFAGVSLP